MSVVSYVTNESAPPVEIPKGSSVSHDPIENGVVVINAAVPSGEDGHMMHRTVTADEAKSSRKDAVAVAGWRRGRALGYLRMTRGDLLGATDFITLPDNASRFTAEERAAWDGWRQELRDITKSTPDPDAVTYPEPPSAVSALLPWRGLWPGLPWPA